MSLKALPILFLNMGGEMLYILEQRLRNYDPPEKGQRALHEIMLLMFETTFMEDLFQPQDTYSYKGQIFRPAARRRI